MRSILYSFLCVFVVGAIAVSCGKEVSKEIPGAKILLKDSGGNCLAAVVSGVYQQDSLLTAANYIDQQVNVTIPGNYYITTSSINGFKFSGQGYFATTGLQSVRLLAEGTPVEEGDFIFTIEEGDSTCAINVHVISAVPAATFTITNAAGDCPTPDINGVYMANIPTDSTNFISFDVDVTTTGSWALATDPVNGIVFEGSGVFSGTGVQQVTLFATGTPLTAGNSTFNFSGDTSGCSFTVAVQPEITTPAVFSINCSPVQLSGFYTAGVSMDAGNTATVNVTVTTAGKYTISTTTVNGIAFTASGTFTAASPVARPVVLAATGTPVARGTFSFPVSGGGSSCSFPVIFDGPAEFTLAGAPGACTAATVNGIYNTGVDLGSSNTVTVSVNVTATGPYTITTNTVNGMSFSVTGSFIATGIQNVTLAGSGKPTAAGTFTFMPQAGSSTCTFDVTVADIPVDPGVYTCKIDGVFTAFNDRARAENKTLLTPNTLAFDGYTGPATGGYVPELSMYINNNDGSFVNPGTYNVDGLIVPGYHIEIDYFETDGVGGTRWNTSSTLLTPNPPFTIIITSRTADRIKGTFSGEVTNIFEGSTKRKKITEGVFDLPLY